MSWVFFFSDQLDGSFESCSQALFNRTTLSSDSGLSLHVVVGHLFFVCFSIKAGSYTAEDNLKPIFLLPPPTEFRNSGVYHRTHVIQQGSKPKTPCTPGRLSTT